MKKYVFVAVLLVASISISFGQTEKGRFSISGASDLSFISAKTKGYYDGKKLGSADVSNFGFETSASYFVVDNLAIGLGIGFESSKFDEVKESSFIVGPMARYYFGASKMKPYLGASLGFGSGKVPVEGKTEKFKQFGWDAEAGVAIFLNDFVALDLGLSYGSLNQKSKEDSKAETKTSGFGTMAGFSIFF